MGATDLFSPKLWQLVGDHLAGTALDWWKANRDELVELGREEAEDVLRALRDGDMLRAKMEIVGHMDRDEWRAYRKATTAQLQGIAARRSRLIRALEDLAMRIAEIIGKAAGSALGF